MSLTRKEQQELYDLVWSYKPLTQAEEDRMFQLLDKGHEDDEK